MDVSAADSLGFSARVTHPGAMRDDHAHGDLELNILLAGRVRYIHAGATIDLPRERLAVFWAALPHRLVETSDDARMALAVIPLSDALRWGLAERAMGDLMRGAFLIAPAPSTIDAALARQWAEDADTGIDPGTTKLEIQARVRRLCNVAEILDPDDGDVIVRMTRWLEAHHREACSLDDLARAVGLHPKYASTRFRLTCGMSPWQYLLRLRVATAQRLLLTTRHTVLAIAEQAGFGSQARCYAAFQDVCGESPGRWRRRHRRGS